jgi:pyruvate dehydrogenase E2 component (dihydrolipoamide acetyltransferase)
MNILMPQLGETVAEGKITKWFKAAGDAVKPGDNLFEIETDKVSMEVPATEAGVLSEIRVPEGEVALVGAVVGVIGDGTGGAASAPAKPATSAAAAPKAPTTAPSVTDRAPPPVNAPQQPIKLDPFFEVRTPERNFGPARLSGGIFVTPLARRLASEAGIDLSRLRASKAPARTAASSRAMWKLRHGRPLHPASPHWRKARAPIRSRRSSILPATKKCRSTRCAKPSPRG